MLSEQKKRIWKKRILKLAEKYGPFVRFYPEGSEGSEDEVVVKDGDKPSTRTPEEQKQIDESRKHEQMLEQERANVAKAKETARQVQTDLESVKSENDTLKEKLQAAEAKAADAGIDDVKLDESEYTGTDLALVRAIESLKTQIKAKDKRIAVIEKKAEGYEEQSRKEKAIASRNSAYEEILSDLDGEYGADCRNAAVKKFDELIADGKVPKGNTAKATRILEKCYKEVKTAKSKDTKTDKSSFSLDSGSGGGTSPNLSGVEIKEGSLDEVAAQYAAATKK